MIDPFDPDRAPAPDRESTHGPDPGADTGSERAPDCDSFDVDRLPPPAPSAWSERQAPSARVPNIGHAVIFLSFALLVLLLCQLVLLAPRAGHSMQASAQVVMQPKLQIATMAVAYSATLGFCFLVFPLFWRRGFLAGVHWDGSKALRLAGRLLPLGFALGLTVQAISSLIPMPKSIPMDEFFRSRSDVWLVTLFGTTLAPIFEELSFRGFLLPAFAIALDWLGPLLRYLSDFSLARLRGKEPPRHMHLFAEARSAGLGADSDNLTFRSRTAAVGASILTSILFALLHAEQLAHAWAAVIVLFFVSLALTVVRVRTRSVACSTLVHASYNLSVFVTLFFATGGYRHLEKMTQ
ncbi:MAG TPA: CPBP family intramembrane glutamic endopeptidase [Granulicella sp.]|jgi:membrane protease YdiL (CAAX protease family)|nr:CPBP family intramembrane glutamic endopeptidase [Granulicella sp.]